MITTIKVWLTSVTSYRLKKVKKKEVFPFVMQALRVHSPNNFSLYHAAILATVILLYIISLALLYLTALS